MDLPAAFASLAARVSAAVGGPYVAGQVIDQANVQMDDGGSVVASDAPGVRGCQVQIDAATWGMRQSDGFVDGDLRFIVLAATLDGALGTDARINVLSGPSAGAWMVSQLTLDPVGVGFEGRGRRA